MKKQELSKQTQGRDDREELGALLRLLATLGFTVGGGISAFFSWA